MDTSAAKTTSDEIKYDKYCNGRFGYCIEYMAGVFNPQPESDNGDGRIFTSSNDEETLRVYGALNLDAEGYNIPLEKKFKMDQATYGSSISYKKLGNDFFVISGEKKGKLYYQKTIGTPESFYTSVLLLDKENSETFKLQSEKIFETFK